MVIFMLHKVMTLRYSLRIDQYGERPLTVDRRMPGQDTIGDELTFKDEYRLRLTLGP